MHDAANPTAFTAPLSAMLKSHLHGTVDLAAKKASIRR
jgi:hypothetical protein